MSDESDEVGQWRPFDDSGLMVAAGSWCPACKEDGGMFHFGPNAHQCENCLRLLTDKKYYEFLMKNPAPRK